MGMEQQQQQPIEAEQQQAVVQSLLNEVGDQRALMDRLADALASLQAGQQDRQQWMHVNKWMHQLHVVAKLQQQQQQQQPPPLANQLLPVPLPELLDFLGQADEQVQQLKGQTKKGHKATTESVAPPSKS